MSRGPVEAARSASIGLTDVDGTTVATAHVSDGTGIERARRKVVSKDAWVESFRREAAEFDGSLSRP